jgi:hypothetical protein
MAQTSLNSTGVASSGALSLQSNGTTEAIGISTGQVATLAQNPILTSGTANGVAYLNGSKVLTTGSALVFDGTNLGLGVTPSAWSGAVPKAIQVGAGSYIASNTDGTLQLGANGYYNGSNFIYTSTAYAGRYSISTSTGAHSWQVAASGTAGNTITFTQAMTLDASGNLLVGSTSLSTATGNKNIEVNGTGDSAFNVSVGGTNYGYLYTSTSSTILGTRASIPLVFNTANTERARIDSSGNLLVGTTTNSVSSGGLISRPNNGGTGSSAFLVGHATGTASGDFYQLFTYGASAIGSITQSGTAAVLYNVTSDQRLKENIVNAPEFGSVIDSIKVRSFDWITDQTHQRAGFIAQELVTVAPEAVHQPKNEEDMMAVDYSKLVPMLVKEIQSLRQRLEAAGI